MARGQVRKRQKHKPDLSNVRVSITKKRGRTIVTPEAVDKRNAKDILAEAAKYKQARKAEAQAKTRKGRQPAPIEERKALDHMPVQAGTRLDRRKRREKQQERKARLEATRELRRKLQREKEEHRQEEVEIQGELGPDFFAEGDDVSAANAATPAPAAAE
mmetsp:Transcript_26604/g.62122  ORF Transcript_26604/g.62122 Transcript_26604/m.62122 type:complete len:160 (+) Transcript_26604:61-540(+)